MNTNPDEFNSVAQTDGSVSPTAARNDSSTDNAWHDRQIILNIYMQRPSGIAWMNFGHWFTEATGQVFPQLSRCANIPEAMRLIESKQLSMKSKLDLKTLARYNRQFWEK